MPKPSKTKDGAASHFDEMMRRALSIKPEAKPKKKSGAKRKK